MNDSGFPSKYPRTFHLEGSLDRDLTHENVIPFSEVRGPFVVVEEKVDGSNLALSFNSDGVPNLQTRGTVLHGGPRERQFDLLKAWVSCCQANLFAALGSRYVLYGDWLYAKHTVYYDQLPHFFLEYDVFDRTSEIFLSTSARRQLLADLPIVSVPILYEGTLETLDQVRKLLGRSSLKSDHWRESFVKASVLSGSRGDLARAQTDPSDFMEGLYLKVETDSQVVARYKFVRPGFLATLLASGSHWQDRPIIPNQLRAGVDIYAP